MITLKDITTEQIDDFESVLSVVGKATPEVAEVTAPEPEPDPIPDPEIIVPEKAPVVTLEEQSIASDFIIGLIDISTTLPLTLAAKVKRKKMLNRIGGEEAKIILGQAKETVEAGGAIKDLTETEKKLLSVDIAVKEYLASLPLSEPEKEKLEAPLRKMIKDNNYVIPPWLSLVLSLVISTTNRVAGLMSI